MNVFMTGVIVCDQCGRENAVHQSVSVRVNKHTLRSTGLGIGVMPPACKSCGAELPDVLPSRWQLTPDDAAKIKAIRAKRWPSQAPVVAGSATLQPPAPDEASR